MPFVIITFYIKNLCLIELRRKSKKIYEKERYRGRDKLGLRILGINGIHHIPDKNIHNFSTLEFILNKGVVRSYDFTGRFNNHLKFA